MQIYVHTVRTVHNYNAICERRYKVILHTVIFHTQFTIGLIRMNEGMPLALPYCMSKLRGYIRNLPEVLPYTATTSY